MPLPKWLILIMPYSTLVKVADLFNFNIKREQFLIRWTLTFGDSIEFTNATFNAFDIDKNNKWTITEVDKILRTIKTDYG